MHELIGFLGQGAATARPAQAALARPGALGLLRPVRLVPLGRRQAGVARRLRRLAQPRFQFRHPRRSRLLHLRPQGQDQGVLLGLGELGEIGRRDHPAVKPPASRPVNGADSRPTPRSSYPRDEQLPLAWKIHQRLGLGWRARHKPLGSCKFRVLTPSLCDRTELRARHDRGCPVSAWLVTRRRQAGACRLRRRPADLGRGRAGARRDRAQARPRRSAGPLHRGSAGTRAGAA